MEVDGSEVDMRRGGGDLLSLKGFLMCVENLLSEIRALCRSQSG